MRVNHGSAPVELVEYRTERRVAQPVVTVAGQQADTVCLQRVKGIFDFPEAILNSGQRQHGKQAQPSFMIGDGPGPELVHFTREAARFLRLPKPHTG